MKRKILFTLMVSLLAGGAFAAITTTGYVSPANPGTWDNATIGKIGGTTDGTMTINGGSTVIDQDGNAGYSAGVTGTVTVTGSGSAWTNTRSLYVGNYGTGNLTVSNGGMVHSVDDPRIGWAVGSVGTVTVTGSGSLFNAGTTGNLDIGGHGAGTLIVSNGGRVESGTHTRFGVYGDTGCSGTATVTGSGSRWNTSSYMSLGLNAASSGNLTVSDSGTVSVGADIRVGDSGTGNLIVSNGGKLNASISYFGRSGTTGSGTALVTGSGSVWTTTNAMTMGYSGTGAQSLTVSNGGSVVVGKTLTMANAAGSTAELSLYDAATEVSVEQIVIGNDATDDATVNLFAGLLKTTRTASTGFSIFSNGVNGISFEKGVLRLARTSSDATDALETCWEDGLFTGDNGNDLSFTNNLTTITYTQDLGNGNTAYVGNIADGSAETFVVIPEPATIGLFVVATASIILLRRHRSF